MTGKVRYARTSSKNVEPLCKKMKTEVDTGAAVVLIVNSIRRKKIYFPKDSKKATKNSPTLSGSETFISDHLFSSILETT